MTLIMQEPITFIHQYSTDMLNLAMLLLEFSIPFIFLRITEDNLLVPTFKKTTNTILL